jgi:hypothetical protein
MKACPLMRTAHCAHPLVRRMLHKASEANIAHRTLLLAYTHIKAFEQRRATGRLP